MRASVGDRLVIKGSLVMETVLRPELAVIDPERCRQLLRQSRVGRVAVAVDGRPEVIPVWYVFDGKAVQFRPAPGTALSDSPLTEGPLAPMAFEIDAIDESARSGWTVGVHGCGRRRGEQFELLIEEISGRRVVD